MVMAEVRVGNRLTFRVVARVMVTAMVSFMVEIRVRVRERDGMSITDAVRVRVGSGLDQARQ